MLNKEAYKIVFIEETHFFLPSLILSPTDTHYV